MAWFNGVNHPGVPPEYGRNGPRAESAAVAASSGGADLGVGEKGAQPGNSVLKELRQFLQDRPSTRCLRPVLNAAYPSFGVF
jgi:hypothetical protein